METKLLLEVSLVGGLKIASHEFEFPYERKRSAQVELLIVYLIINRNISLTNSQLIDFLWPNNNLDKPEGALRNLVYRARKEMKQFFGQYDCIESKGRRYFWNLDVECKVDYEELVSFCDKIIAEQDPIQKYKLCLDLVEKYHGDILPELNHNSWVNEINSKLATKCLDTVIETVLILGNYNMHEKILEICNHHNCQKMMNMELCEIQLYSYYWLKKIDAGLSFYRKVVDYYYCKYGIEVSKKLKKLYKMILNTSSIAQVGVEELEKNLISDSSDENTFYCDFDVFKNIYQINIRSVRRSMKARVLALLTIIDASNCLDEKAILEETEILKEVIFSSLRKNDVFSKFNMIQYAVILASPNIDGAQKAVNRILERYNDKKRHEEAILIFDLRQIR